MRWLHYILLDQVVLRQDLNDLFHGVVDSDLLLLDIVLLIEFVDEFLVHDSCIAENDRSQGPEDHHWPNEKEDQSKGHREARSIAECAAIFDEFLEQRHVNCYIRI